MLMAHPTVLRTLVERYETLRALADQYGAGGAEAGGSADPRVRQQLQDTVYTLCVSTGTREIGPALAAARDHMERSAFGAGEAAEQREAA
jgi:hypothetical protein